MITKLNINVKDSDLPRIAEVLNYSTHIDNPVVSNDEIIKAFEDEIKNFMITLISNGEKSIQYRQIVNAITVDPIDFNERP